MKKVILIILALIISLTNVSAYTNGCDFDGDGDIDLFDAMHQSIVISWFGYADQDLRVDLYEDGQIDLNDVIIFSQNIQTEGWCHETFWRHLEPKPDLAVSDIVFNPENPRIGDQVTTTVIFTNLGDIETQYVVSIQPESPSGLLEAEEYPLYDSLYPGETKVIDIVFDISEQGIYTVTAEIWPVGTEDLNLSNNIMVKTIEGYHVSGPDLAILDVNFYPEGPLLGDTLTISGEITNLGDIPSTHSTGMSFSYPDGQTVGAGGASNPDNPLEPGEIINFSFGPFNLDQEGEYHFEMEVFSNEEDINLNNNFYARTFYVSDSPPEPAPDLVITNIEMPEPAIVGREVDLYMRITNQGTASANAVEFFVDFEPNKKQELTKSKFSLSPGESRIIYVGYTYEEEGEHYLYVELDPRNIVDESDETNNEITFPIFVEPNLPDLNLDEVDIDINYNILDLEIEIENEGHVPINGFDYAIEYGDGSVEFISYLGTLNPGEDITLELQHEYSEYGTYSIDVFLDPYDEIEEIREDNNHDDGTVHYYPPHFEVTSINFYLDGEIIDYEDDFLYIPTTPGTFTIELEIENLLGFDIDNLKVWVGMETNDETWEYYTHVDFDLDADDEEIITLNIPIPDLGSDVHGDLDIEIESETHDYGDYEQEFDFDVIFSLEEEPCVIPTDGMIITEDTTFCEGEYYLPNGIEIVEWDVTLDCNGATLNGDYTNEIGILIGEGNIIVENCNINNYYRGIRVYDVNNTIKNNFISNSSVALELRPSSGNNIIEGNFMTDNSYTIDSQSDMNYFLNNTILNSYSPGIILYNSNYNHLEDNTITGVSHGGGISISDATGNSIINNTLEFNEEGISLVRSNENIVIENNVISNLWNNIHLTESNNNIINMNTFSNSLNSNGIKIENSNGNAITRNYFVSNDRAGISITGTSEDNTINYNDIYDNNGLYDFINNQESNIVATLNYWGTVDEEEIRLKIYDKEDNPELGEVTFIPFLDQSGEIFSGKLKQIKEKINGF
jgi:parallel beta-helix repeat protein